MIVARAAEDEVAAAGAGQRFSAAGNRVVLWPVQVDTVIVTRTQISNDNVGERLRADFRKEIGALEKLEKGQRVGVGPAGQMIAGDSPQGWTELTIRGLLGKPADPQVHGLEAFRITRFEVIDQVVGKTIAGLKVVPAIVGAEARQTRQRGEFGAHLIECDHVATAAAIAVELCEVDRSACLLIVKCRSAIARRVGIRRVRQWCVRRGLRCRCSDRRPRA